MTQSQATMIQKNTEIIEKLFGAKYKFSRRKSFTLLMRARGMLHRKGPVSLVGHGDMLETYGEMKEKNKLKKDEAASDAENLDMNPKRAAAAPAGAEDEDGDEDEDLEDEDEDLEDDCSVVTAELGQTTTIMMMSTMSIITILFTYQRH